jgi:hypothetical protein
MGKLKYIPKGKQILLVLLGLFAFFLLLGFIFFAISFFRLSFLTLPNTNSLLIPDCGNGNLSERFSTIYVGLGTILTACFFGGTLYTIYYQHKTVLRATSLDVFTRIYVQMQDEPQFKAIFEYILSKIPEKMTIEEMNKKFVTWNKDEKQYRLTVYKSLEYFCSKMEYVGTLIRNDYVAFPLLYPTGGRIVSAYNKLNKTGFSEELSQDKYLHFGYLVYFINKTQRNYNTFRNDVKKKIEKYKKKQAKQG